MRRRKECWGELRYLREWADWMEAQGRASETTRQYRYAVLRLLADALKDSLNEVTEQDVVVFLASLGRRTASKQLYLHAFKSFFGWAVSHGHIDKDPSEHLRPKTAAQREPDAYTPEEVMRLIEAAERTADRPDLGKKRGLAILAAYALGLRRSELCGLKPEDIDWEGRRVFIRIAKGDHPRVVEMNELAEQALRGLQPYYNGTVVGGMHPQWFTAIVFNAAKEAGLPPKRRKAHMLRSSFATHLLGEGVPISVVSKLLGHTQVATTSRYLSVRSADRREAVDRLRLPAQTST